MRLSKLNKVLIVAGLTGVIGTAIATAIGTYKAYPKIKKGIDEGESPIDIAKKSVKDFAPAIGVVAVTGGCMVASEVIGERKLNDLKYKLTSAKRKYDTVSTWYKDQTQAIENKMSEKNKEAIKEEVKALEAEVFEHTTLTKIATFHDPFTGVTFESTEGDILLAINDAVNKNLMINGYATYEDFYGYLGLDTPDDFRNFGWSFSTASAMWCDPWVSVQFVQDVNEDGEVYETIEYVSDYGQGYVMPFEPVEEPQSEGWN